ncbi:MAG TPA: protein-L-isoaspartate(D-aspartate) O-methyltransferase [Polyangiaceae bacterium]|nr:protein-L-isoaspartate(D-aspartate) O-methyltransferase [Polyangiaceae bacterium]
MEIGGRSRPFCLTALPFPPSIASASRRAHDAGVESLASSREPRAERERLARAIESGAKVEDPRILAAFGAVPREAFVPSELAELAYEDRALPIGAGQTISQPSMIALMLAALEPQPTDHALEVGSGSGYAAALLGRLTASVLGLEIVPELAERARQTLARLEVPNVSIETGDGVAALGGRGPFDLILVSAAAREVPAELLEHLASGGRIAIPVGSESGQHLLAGRRGADGAMHWQQSTPCVFVPLVGASSSALSSIPPPK